MEKLLTTLLRSAVSGVVADWIRPSPIREFVQPWYAPLPVSPETTGVALGGLGCSHVVNPRGRTAALHFLSSAPVLNDGAGVELHDFYYSERDTLDSSWRVRSRESLLAIDARYPLVRSNGERWLLGSSDVPGLELRLNEMCQAADLVAGNVERLQRWCLPLSIPPLELLRLSPRERNVALLSELFGSAVAIGSPWQRSLMAMEGRRSGVPCFSDRDVRYSALFPALGFTYSTASSCQIQRVSFSPVVAGGRDVALPLTITRFMISNPTARAKTVTLAWLGENINGYRRVKARPGEQDASHQLLRTAAGQVNARVPIRGADVCLLLSGTGAEGGVRGTTAMAMAVSGTGSDAARATSRTEFYPSQRESVIGAALACGALVGASHRWIPCDSDSLCGALAATVEVPPGARVCIDCVLVVDYPDLEIGEARARKYAPPLLQSSANDSEMRARSILEYAFEHRERLADEVSDYHTHVERLVDQKLHGQSPRTRQRAFSTMMATLSNLCESAIWTDSGAVFVRECVDYPYFNSLDVYFYGSFALAHLLPEVDQAIVRAFMDATIRSIPEERAHWHYAAHPRSEGAARHTGARKLAWVPPHDLGSPFDARPNAYDFHDTKDWQDLGPKLVLLAYRSYLLTRARPFPSAAYDVSTQLMRRTAAQLEPGRALPLAFGTSNTYDNLTCDGTQIYNAQLWLAALEAYLAMGRALGDSGSDSGDAPHLRQWKQLLADGRKELFARLWDPDAGRFNYATGPISKVHLRAGAPLELAARLKWTNLDASESVVSALNGLIYAAPNDEARWQAFEALCGEELGHVRKRPKAERIASAKRVLWRLDEALWSDGFAEYANTESDALFADQLIGDYYLQKLGLPSLCNAAQMKSVLLCLYRVGFVGNSPIVGIPNLVRADGTSFPAFQAQDVWLGVNFTIAELMRQCGLEHECEHLLSQLFEVIYDCGRIPFGLPEGFNCTYSGGAEASPEHDELIHHLADRSRAALAPSHREFSAPMPSGLRCPLFTAGRYLRPGSIFGLLW